MDTGGLTNCPDGGPGDDPGSGARWHEDDARCAKTSVHFVWDGVAVEANRLQTTRGDLDCLFDARRNFVRLAVTPANTAVAVTYDHQSSEAESPASLDDGSAALDLDYMFDQLASLAV